MSRDFGEEYKPCTVPDLPQYENVSVPNAGEYEHSRLLFPCVKQMSGS